MNSIVYLGFYRNTEVIIKKVSNQDIKNGYKLVNCFECNGTGIWDFVEYIESENCVCCKGTGKVLINV